MDYPYSASAPAPAEHPVYAMLVSFPVACFTLTLLSDLAFWRTSNLLWQNFSSWLLLAGLVFGGLAALVRLLELLFSRAFRAQATAWLHAVAGLVVLALALVNSLVHAGDGWTAVVPNGLILSAATVAVMLVAAGLGRSLLLRRAARVSTVYD